MKTEYRILTYDDCHYLQFKSTYKLFVFFCPKKECWRFISTNADKYINEFSGNRGKEIHVNSYYPYLYGPEQKLKNFVSRYPYIEDYFSEHNGKLKDKKTIKIKEL